MGSVGAIAISAIACVLTQALWGLPIGGLEVAALPLVIVSVVVIALQPDRNVIGHIFYASFTSAFLTSVAYAAYLAVVASHSILEAVTASFVILLDVGALVVWISYINYQSDVLCRSRRGRPLPVADPGYKPMVSIHIPAYNEPPELLIETIKAAEAIDYPDFEVVVMDNNTKDPAVWQPVEEYCRDRDRVKFVHVAPWPGYKAGACNLALRRYTDPRAEVIGLVDADDLVQPHYLRETVPYFSDPRLGFVQTFEGNREFEGSPYYTACVDSYQAFYLSNMSARTERDSVPFVGTMGLFRRSALTAIGGWNEWCISEDTEASLRVLKNGWSGLYLPRCFGRGVVPPSFAGMLTQRHRWCFGGMQILRLHWRSLMPWDRSPDNHLTAAQRRDYLMASLGWFRDLLMLIFSLLLLVITGLLVTDSRFAVAPMVGSWSVLPVSLIIIATFCMMWTLRHWTTMSYRRALLSLVISLAVAWVVALGCIEGIARRDGVFLRTAKAGGRHTIFTAMRLARVETILAVALYACVGLLACAAPAVAAHRHRLVPGHRVHLRPDRGDVEPAGAGRPRPGVPAPFCRRPPARRAPPSGRRAPFPRPAAAALTALCVGGVTSAFVFPVPLLHATSVTRGAAVEPTTSGGHPGLPQAGLVRGRDVLPGQVGAPVGSDAQLRHVLARCCSARSSRRPRTAGTSRTSASRSARRGRRPDIRPSTRSRRRSSPRLRSTCPARLRAASRSCFHRGLEGTARLVRGGMQGRSLVRLLGDLPGRRWPWGREGPRMPSRRSLSPRRHRVRRSTSASPRRRCRCLTGSSKAWEPPSRC